VSAFVTTQDSARAVLLAEPADGVPDVVADPKQLAEAVARLAAGSGPVAVDAERASGYRYGQRAYLVQLRREGSGTLLIDPIPFPDLLAIQHVIGGEEWILHAAHQDLPCLAEVGLRPSRVFDTELAARLAGFERVGLASVVEQLLGYTLEKGFSAADWSTRPLPQDWLRYAALDVELLIELRELLGAELERQGKLAWAEQEFAAAAKAEPKPPPADPWRRTSGIHRVRSRRQLASVRALWFARDARARDRDIAPGRVLPDSAIVNAALTAPKSREALAGLPVFSGPRMRRSIQVWWDALHEAMHLPDAELPGPAASTGLPPAGRWADRDPAAAARLAATRYTLRAIAAEHALPAENLLEPALQRKLAWSPPNPIDPRAVAEALSAGGARPWQVELTADALAAALLDPEPIAAAAQAEAEAARLEAEEAQRALIAQAEAAEPAAS
jgi:ribonuclease D